MAAKKKRRRRVRPVRHSNGRRRRRVQRYTYGIVVLVPILGFAWWIVTDNLVLPERTPRFERSTAGTVLHDPISLDEAVGLSAEYLHNQIEGDGQFLYRVNINPDVLVKPRYNILRHAGTIYALGTHHERTGDPESAKAVSEACSFLHSQISHVPNHPGMKAIWSNPTINHRDRPLQGKLGGTGLGLVALLAGEQAEPGLTSIGTLRDLGNFVLFMQRQDGSFYSTYYPRDDEFSAWVSLYYPGEAALGLVMLYEHDPDEKWLNGAIAAMEYLAETRRGQRDVPHDHWALLATARLFEQDQVQQNALLRKILVGHAEQICEAILRTQITASSDPLLDGAFGLDGRTTPCATRMEGLLAALAFLPCEKEELRTSIEEACHRGLGFLRRSQIVEREASGGVPRSIYGNPRFAHLVDKDRDPRATEIRIDYTQHALSAMMQYQDLFEDRVD